MANTGNLSSLLFLLFYLILVTHVLQHKEEAVQKTERPTDQLTNTGRLSGPASLSARLAFLIEMKAASVLATCW